MSVVRIARVLGNWKSAEQSGGEGVTYTRARPEDLRNTPVSRRQRAARDDNDDELRRDDLLTLAVIFVVLAIAFWCATDERASDDDYLRAQVRVEFTSKPAATPLP